MRPPDGVRIPIAVRVGRRRLSFRMPPIHMRASGATITMWPSLRYRVAMQALTLAIYPMAALAWLLRTDAEVITGEESP